MVSQPHRDIRDLVREVGTYPPDAFQFVQEGLIYTVQETHGEMSEPQRILHQFMADQNLDLDQLETFYLNGQLPEEIRELIEQAGGVNDLSRHVSGQKLCWGLREYALSRWGALASTVLGQWNIKRTRDFGEIVFALVNSDFLQRQPNDSINDFDDVFDFEEAFDRSFHINMSES